MLYRDIIHATDERSFEPDFAELIIPELPKFVTSNIVFQEKSGKPNSKRRMR
jgi:hypothetical protein